MKNFRSRRTTGAQIATDLGAHLIGDDSPVSGVGALPQDLSGKLAFSVSGDADRLQEFEGSGVALLIIPKGASFAPRVPHVRVGNPRLAYAKAAVRFGGRRAPCPIGRLRRYWTYRGVQFGPGVVVEYGAKIGAGTIIYANAVLRSCVDIGRDCIVKSGAVIGEDAFGFERDDESIPVHIPHFGRVVIGDAVEIGANAVIARGTIGDTVIGSHVKLNDLCRIAHNVCIGSRTMCAGFVCGSVHIGKDCWISPGASVRNKVTLGDETLVGLGGVVTESYPEGRVTLVGVPAKPYVKGL